MAGEFDAIEVAAEVVVGEFKVRPITIERLPAFTRALRPILPSLGSLIDIEEQEPEIMAEAIMEVTSEHGDRLIDAVAAAVADSATEIGQARAKVGKLDAAAFVALMLAVLKVNADFFARRLLPEIARARQAAQAATSGAGLTPSRP